jgi:hypothetical protein
MQKFIRPCAELIFPISKMKRQKREKRKSPRNLPGKKIGPEEGQVPEKHHPLAGYKLPHAAVSFLFFLFNFPARLGSQHR